LYGEVDGKVLEEAFEPDFLSLRPVQYEDRSLGKAGPADVSKEGDEEIERRLRSLGYID